MGEGDGMVLTMEDLWVLLEVIEDEPTRRGASRTRSREGWVQAQDCDHPLLETVGLHVPWSIELGVPPVLRA